MNMISVRHADTVVLISRAVRHAVHCLALLELWIPCTMSKEVLERTVEISDRFLQTHAVSLLQKESSLRFLESRQHVCHRLVGKRFLFGFVCLCVQIQHPVVHKTRAAAVYLYLPDLCFCWIDSELESFHHVFSFLHCDCALYPHA